MAKMDLNAVKESQETIANRMEGKILRENDFEGSGLRLSEVSGLNLEDLDLTKSSVRVTRKGGKEQYVYFSSQASLDIENYLQVRETRYTPEKNERFLFIAAPVGRKGKNRRLTQRSIEKLVEKYATAFGKPALTVHSSDVPKLKIQLGHSSIQSIIAAFFILPVQVLVQS